MNTRLLSCIAFTAGVLGMLSLGLARPAQEIAPAATTATPRTAEGHPNMNGLWRAAGGNAAGTADRGADGSVSFTLGRRGQICDDDPCQDPNQPAYKPEYASEVKVIAQAQSNGTNPLDPQFECKPLGIPRGTTGAMQVVQGAKMMAILYEGTPGPMYRAIYMDGRQHPKDFTPSFLGDSIGHWEGDTLVVDVIGLSGETWLGGGLPGTQKYTSLHSDQEHVIERWTRRGDTITYEATVEDPVMLSRPLVITPRQIQLAGQEDTLQELPCVPDSKLKPAR